MKDELTALVFELQRARSPVDRARALARAWRTVRGLSGSERRLLAREVGFDGAEELVEGLAGKGKGVFAPAAILEALGKMRKDPSLSVRGVLNGLRDPEQRDEFLVRGIDLVADSVVRPEELDELDESEQHDEALELDEDDLELSGEAPEPQIPVVPPPPVVEPEPGQEQRSASVNRDGDQGQISGSADSDNDLGQEPLVEKEPDPSPEPEEPSAWDELAPTAVAVSKVHAVVSPIASVETTETGESVIERLRTLRARIPSLRHASGHEIGQELDGFPEPWARRRALVALIEADVPDSPAAALDLIEDLERPMDRRWCLSTLATRGDLTGADLERALELLTSPAARRRVADLAAVSVL